jgi:hypothetical protein
VAEAVESVLCDASAEPVAESSRSVGGDARKLALVSINNDDCKKGQNIFSKSALEIWPSNLVIYKTW